MNFSKEQDLLNLFQQSDPPPSMEDILLSSTINQNKSCENKYEKYDFKPVSLMQPKPKIIFIPTPRLARPNIPLASEISIPKRVASPIVANHMIIPVKPSPDRSVLHESSFFPPTRSTTIPIIESTNVNSTTLLLPWQIADIAPKIQSTPDFRQFDTHWKNIPAQNKKQKQLDISPTSGSSSQSVCSHWIDVPIITNMKHKQPEIDPTSGSQYNTLWNSDLVEHMKQESKVGYGYLQMTEAKRKELRDLRHVCTICNAAFPTPQSLGGHMSAHVRKRKKIAVLRQM